MRAQPFHHLCAFLFIVAVSTTTASGENVVNGDFETGDLTGWSVHTYGIQPSVVPFDVYGGDGPSHAVRVSYPMTGGTVEISHQAGITHPCNWWSNRSAENNTYDIYGETVRLDSAYSGWIEGTVNLPSPGEWLIDIPVHPDGDLSLPTETVKLYINGDLIAEVPNVPVPGQYNIDNMATIHGDVFTYRFEFSSPQYWYGYHLYMAPGTATLVPEPASVALLGLGALLISSRRRLAPHPQRP